MPVRVFLATSMLLCTSVSCSWQDALDGDPTAWSPPNREDVTVEMDGGGADAGPPPECLQLPALDFSVRASTAAAISHLAGESCLTGCHEEGGIAALAFAAAGTIYVSQGSEVVAAAGNTVQGIGGTQLIVDRCGNFYAVADELKTSPRNTQPWVQNPLFRRMEKLLSKEPKAGDCNQSGCHDFSGKLNVGVYY